MAIPAFVVSKGDPQAGAILVKVNTLDGEARAYQRTFDLLADKRMWILLSEGSDETVEAILDRQKSRDPDIWIVEVEDREARHLLDEPGLVD